MPRYYIDTSPIDDAWECYIRDSESEGEPVAAFLDEDTATLCLTTLNFTV